MSFLKADYWYLCDVHKVPFPRGSVCPQCKNKNGKVMNKKYISPYTKEELAQKYPALDFKRLTIGIILSGIVMWVSALILF